MVSQYKNKRSEVDSEKDVVIETLWFCTVRRYTKMTQLAPGFIGNHF